MCNILGPLISTALKGLNKTDENISGYGLLTSHNRLFYDNSSKPRGAKTDKEVSGRG